MKQYRDICNRINKACGVPIHGVNLGGFDRAVKIISEGSRRKKERKKAVKYRYSGRLTSYFGEVLKRDLNWFKKFRISFGYVDLKKNPLVTIDKISVPSFSDNPIPDADDIQKTRKFIKQISAPFVEVEFSNVEKSSPTWVIRKKSDDIVLKNWKDRKTDKVKIIDCLNFFYSNKWYKSLPKLKSCKVIPYNDITDRQSQLPLYNISKIKGLEADVVIFIVNSPQDNLDKILYIGISRARFYLHLIIDTKTHSKVTQLEINDSSID